MGIGEVRQLAFKTARAIRTLGSHIANLLNPHSVQSLQLSDLPRWEDVAVDGLRALGTGPNQPAFLKFRDNGAGSNGVYAYRFQNGSLRELWFSTQFPHAIALGSDVNFHVHAVKPDANAGSVRIGLEYAFANINGVYGNSNIIFNDIDITAFGAGEHKVLPVAKLPIVCNISDVLVCRVFRDGGVDTYGSPLWLLSFDFHVLYNSIGSYAEGFK